MGYLCTGTIRDNRINSCPLEPIKSISKKGRNTYDCYDKKSKISLVRWNDNSVVTVCSNTYNVHPLKLVKWYNRKEKRDVHIPQPQVIAKSNQFMGGVDLHDIGVAKYRCQVFGKKW